MFKNVILLQEFVRDEGHFILFDNKNVHNYSVKINLT